MEKITINNTTYKVGFSFRAIREFEKLAGKSITECTSTWDNLLFFYATLKALNRETFNMDLEEFTDEMDAHPQLLASFQTETTSEPSAGDSQSPAESSSQQKKSLPLFRSWMLFLLLAVSPVLLPVIFGTLWIWTSLKLLVRPIVWIGKKRESR